MSELDYIDILLDKYFQGETSLQEEEELRQYFSQSNVAAKYKAYEPMFNFFVEERMHADMKQLPKPAKKISMRIWIGAAVACSLLIVGGIRFLSVHNDMSNRSVAYIDGRLVSDHQDLSEQALISIKNVSMDNEVVNEQIDVLNLFTE